MAKESSFTKWAQVAKKVGIDNTAMHNFKTGAYGRLSPTEISKVRKAIQLGHAADIALLDAAVKFHTPKTDTTACAQ